MKRPDMRAAVRKAAGDEKSKIRNPARVGRLMVAGFFPPEVRRQLRQVALDENSTIQALLAEGLNAVFTKRRKPPIA